MKYIEAKTASMIARGQLEVLKPKPKTKRRKGAQSKSKTDHRAEAIRVRGDKCADCGMTNPLPLDFEKRNQFFEFEHTNGDGHLERTRNWKSKMYAEISSGGRDDILLLCPNCHKIRTINSNKTVGVSNDRSVADSLKLIELFALAEENDIRLADEDCESYAMARRRYNQQAEAIGVPLI